MRISSRIESIRKVHHLARLYRFSIDTLLFQGFLIPVGNNQHTYHSIAVRGVRNHSYLIHERAFDSRQPFLADAMSKCGVVPVELRIRYKPYSMLCYIFVFALFTCCTYLTNGSKSRLNIYLVHLKYSVYKSAISPLSILTTNFSFSPSIRPLFYYLRRQTRFSITPYFKDATSGCRP